MTIMIGIDSVDVVTVAGAASDNYQGMGVLRSTDGGKTSQFYTPAGGAMNMDIAENDKGVSVVAYLGGLSVSQNGETYTRVPDIVAGSQSANSFGSSSFGVTGPIVSKEAKSQVNGVAVSLDDAKSWSMYDIGLNATNYPARYGAFPSDTTWYVSAGHWPYDSTLNKETHTPLSARVHMSKDTAQASHLTGLQGPPPAAPGDGDGDGYIGAIAKTTDGGQTWSQVYSTDSYYFNAIHCSTTEDCVAVMENGGDAAAVWSSDGGRTWTTVLHDTGFSFMAAFMVSPTEAWVGGGAKSAHFWHTVNAGADWELTTLPGAYVAYLDFNDGVGYASTLGASTCSIMKYA